MAVTSWKIAASVEALETGPGPEVWFNVADAIDGSLGTDANTGMMAISTNSLFLLFEWDFSEIPAGADIEGIEFLYYRSRSGAGVQDREIFIYRAGSTVGADRSTRTNWPGDITSATVGAADDLWGTTWTVEQAQALAIVFAVRNNNSTNTRRAHVHQVEARVHYTDTGPQAAEITVGINGQSSVAVTLIAPEPSLLTVAINGVANVNATLHEITQFEDWDTYTVTFTPTDQRSTDTGELYYEVRTPEHPDFIVLTSGFTTSGVETTTDPIEDQELIHGTVQRRLVVADGANNTYQALFDVEAFSGSSTFLSVNPRGQSTVSVTLTTPRRIPSVAAGGSATTHILLSTPRRLQFQSHSTSTVTVILRGQPHIDVTIAGRATTDVSFEDAQFFAVDIAGFATVAATIHTRSNMAPDILGRSTMQALLSGRGMLIVDILGTSTTTVRLVTPPKIVIDISGVATVEARMQAEHELIVNPRGRATVQVTFLQTMVIRDLTLRAELHTPAGARVGTGPISTIFNAVYSDALDEVGRFSFSMPATDPMAEHIQSGYEVRLYRANGEGLIFRGIIDHSDVTVDANGRMSLIVNGDAIARQLVWANTLLGREFSNVTMGSAVNTLLAETGWTANSVQTDTRNVTAMFEGASIWQALAYVAELFSWHVRARNLTRTIDVGKLGASSGIVAQNVDTADPDSGVLPITALSITQAQTELWNRVVPIGGGEGINALTIQRSTRTSPYTRRAATGPGGIYHYIQDDASVAAHGLRVKVISAKDVIPISNSTAEIRNAANTLYDIAAAWLNWHAQPHETYDVRVSGLRHIVSGVPVFRVGDTMRMVYRGIVDDPDGNRVWRAVDENLWIIGFTRLFREDGSDEWTFTVSTTDQKTPSDEAAIAKAIDDVWAIKTSKRPYTYREIHGPNVESIAANQTARLLVDFDSQILYLHRAMLRVRKRRVKSNVSGAAAGGGQTVPSGTPQTALSGGGTTTGGGGAHGHSVNALVTPSGGGHTSSAGDAHTHSVTGGTAAGGGAHAHSIAIAQSTQAWSQQPFQQQLLFIPSISASPNFTYGVFVNRGGSSSSSVTFFTSQTTNHQHTLTGITNANESTHRHGILNHSHTVSAHATLTVTDHQHSMPLHSHSISSHTHELPNHSHALIYGIFLGPTATAPQFNLLINGVNRTATLDGPWDTDFQVDVTEFLTDSQGHVLRQANNIEITGSQLCDVEMTLKSLVTATSVVPVSSI